MILTLLKTNGYINLTTIIVAVFCVLAFGLSFVLPKGVTRIGKLEKETVTVSEDE